MYSQSHTMVIGFSAIVPELSQEMPEALNPKLRRGHEAGGRRQQPHDGAYGMRLGGV